jgi:hypothetical protein
LNSKFYQLIILLFLSSCGVKGFPVAPESQKLPSVLDNYPDVKLEKPLDESKIK